MLFNNSLIKIYYLHRARVWILANLYVCFVDRCLSFCTFPFGHCVVCSSSIYRFWLPLWYLQTLLKLFSMYNQICIKTFLRQRKRCLIRQVTSLKRSNSYAIFYDRREKRWPLNTGDCMDRFSVCSEICLNRTLNKVESSINHTLNKVPRNEILLI